MKRLLLLPFLMLTMSYVYSQDDEYQKYLEMMKKEQSSFEQETKNKTQTMSDEFSNYKAKANAEFAEFMAKEWALFEEFKTQELAYSKPKMNEVPSVEESEITSIKSNEVGFANNDNKLPQVAKVANVNSTDVTNKTARTDNYVVRKVVTDKGQIEVVKKDFSSLLKDNVSTAQDVKVNFYGKKLSFNVSPKLRIKNNGVKESDVSNYFKEMSKLNDETSALWKQLDSYLNDMGLNEWGYFCMLRALSEEIFADVNDRVMFIFYLLRNEGDYKVKIARGKESNKLTLLAAIDNSKEVYSYTFFRFNEGNNGQLKYYSIYGGGNNKESIYTYDYCDQDNALKQIGLDFNNVLNMGPCDTKRELTFNKIDKKISLPYNGAHIAYLNDVPMTVFPIYFASPISIEAQQVFNMELNQLKQEYTPAQFIDIMLNFVQTAFEYKTDEQQFGYEKYFYPEEVIAYPYSDCEDRSALFAWLVTTYTNAKVVGLQYEGHLATAVCFGNDVSIDGDSFSYAGRKYYVCDPTYINASIGMTMPQFKGAMPKIIKMSK